MHTPGSIRLILLNLSLLSMSLSLGACGGDEVSSSEIEERCSDGVDNNGDGKTDCEDVACAAFPTCTGSEHCYNGIDDNGDGNVDCADELCKGSFLCLSDIEDCANGRDDDFDGDIDCDDSACARTSVCQPGFEACTGGTDEDNDGDIDCDDDDCKSVFVCVATFELPGNGIDDDDDGQVDCDDADIAMTSDCVAGGEVCDNGFDDDGDGNVDCADTSCASTSVCLRPAEVCNNGVDDDGDGLIDCDDSRCGTSAFCLAEICDDGVDNDSDGDVDCDDSDCPDTLSNCLDFGELCGDEIDNDNDGDIDCEDANCMGDPVCTPPVEVCDDGVDNDEDDIVDCDDEDCAGADVCMCPLDAAGAGPDCSDARCATESLCVCDSDAMMAQRTDPVTGALVPDCALAACQQAYPTACTQGDVEICDATGVDNDNNGLAGCDDPACHDFEDNDAYCTKLLCGDPANSYEVREYVFSAGTTLSISSQADADTLAGDDATLMRGSLILNGGAFMLSNTALRCMVPDMDGTSVLSVNTRALNDMAALGNLVVVHNMDVIYTENTYTIGVSAFTGLRHALDSIFVTEPDFDVAPDEAIAFTGLDGLRTIGGDLGVEYNFNNERRAISAQGLGALVHVGGSLFKTLADAESRDAPFGCRAFSPNSQPDFLNGYSPIVSGFEGLEALRYIGEDLCFTPPTDFTDFAGLEQLRQIDGNVWIGRAYPDEPSSLRFNGLGNLTQVGGDFRVVADHNMFSTNTTIVDSVEGLDVLTSVGGHMVFVIDENLSDFTGLGQLTTIGESFQVMSLPAFQSMSPSSAFSFAGLERLTTIGGVLSNRSPSNFDNPARRPGSFGGLSSLTQVGGLHMMLDESFTDFTGLEQLTMILGDVDLGKPIPDAMLGESLTPISWEGLTNLTTIEGDVYLFILDFVDFTGLESLTEIQGALDFTVGVPSDITLFTDCTGLGALQRIGGLLRISYNGPPNLPHFAPYVGLTSLNYIGNLSTGFTPITSLSGLENVTEVGTLGISFNQLTSLDGLEGLTIIGSMELAILNSLSDFSALGNVQRIGELGSTSIQTLRLHNLPLMTNLDFLSSLDTVHADILLHENDSLNDISRLNGLNEFNGTRLHFYDNPQLPCGDVATMLTTLGLVSMTPFTTRNDGNDCS